MKAQKHSHHVASTALKTFEFHGDPLMVVPTPDGDFGVVLKRLCEVVPIDAEGQRQRLARLEAAGARWATTFVIKVVGDDGKTRAMRVLPRRSIPMWAATVDLDRVREEDRPGIRAKLALYQDECAEVLADHFIGRRGSAQPVMPPEVIEALTALPLLAKAVVDLRKDLEVLRAQVGVNGGVISGNQLDELRRAIDYNVRSLVALGDYENLKAARMAVNNRVVSVSGWGGLGKLRHLMPSAVFSGTMAMLSGQRKDLDRRMRAVRKDAPRNDEQRSFTWGSKEPAQA